MKTGADLPVNSERLPDCRDMIEFARTHIIGRAAGHSAVKAAAYRSGTKQYDRRNGLTADYQFRVDEVAHSEILLPDGAPEAFLDRSVLWNEIELAEDQSTRRSSAQLAKDHIIALPRELNLFQQIELARDFARTLTAQGVGVDLNVHLHSQDNPHAHLMTTTRIIDESGIGGKARHLNGAFAGGRKVVEAEQLRHTWATFQNQWCEARGIDLFVTNNDGQWRPEIHNGPKTHMAVLDEPLASREHIQSERGAAIQKDISALVDRVAKKKAVFSAHDLYRELHRHISDAADFANTKAVLDKYLKGAGAMKTRAHDRQFFTVRETLDTELELKHMATELLKPSSSHVVNEQTRARVIAKRFDFLSDEQKAAVKHITGAERMSVVIGFAGTGKSTMLAAAATTLRKAGHRVIGAALAGIAADGLEQGAQIKSSTIHRLLLRLDKGQEKLRRSDVLVIDEAGMIDSALMHKLVSKVHQAGAKVVLVGDAEQLQPINAGGPLRSLSEQGGYCEINTIRRQNSDVDRQATSQLAKGNANAAWQSYEDRGAVTTRVSVDEAIGSLVDNAVADIEAGHSIAVLAHTNRHVNKINHDVRSRRIDAGSIKNEAIFKALKPGSTKDMISLDVGTGDRILFRRNDTGLGVKNGSLGSVISASDGEIEVALDDGSLVEFTQERYNDIAHGYAMTIHKSQGVTVDKSHVLVSNGWDRHLAYVAMSRHREDLKLYLGEEQFQKYTVTDTISQARVQESAIDFAQRHAIDVQEENGSIVLLDRPENTKQESESECRATSLLRQGLIPEAFRQYESEGKVIVEDTSDKIMERLVTDTVAEFDAGERVSVLAHTRQSVAQLNEAIRAQRISTGAIDKEIAFAAQHQTLDICIGERILFDRDDQSLGVKNGQFATVIDNSGGKLKVKLDDDRAVQFSSSDYNSLSYGYAMTINRSRSAVIQSAKVLLSRSFSRQLSLTAMTQHRKALHLYYAKAQFKKGSPVAVMTRERSGGQTGSATITMNRGR